MCYLQSANAEKIGLLLPPSWEMERLQARGQASCQGHSGLPWGQDPVPLSVALDQGSPVFLVRTRSGYFLIRSPWLGTEWDWEDRYGHKWPGHPLGSLDRQAKLGLKSKMPTGGISVGNTGPAHGHTACRGSWEHGEVGFGALMAGQGGISAMAICHVHSPGSGPSGLCGRSRTMVGFLCHVSLGT